MWLGLQLTLVQQFVFLATLRLVAVERWEEVRNATAFCLAYCKFDEFTHTPMIRTDFSSQRLFAGHSNERNIPGLEKPIQ
jgi:hypothetical protein